MSAERPPRLRREKPAKTEPLAARYIIRTTHDGKAKAEARALAAGMRLSDFVRAQVENAAVRPVAQSPANSDAVAALAHQLQRQGKNLNDLVKFAHIHGQIESHADLRAVLVRMMRTWEAVETLANP